MADVHALVYEAFEQRLAGSTLLDGLDEKEARRLGREAAEAVLGPLVWRQLLGEERHDTTGVARLLGVSRQAVHKRVRNGSLLGVPGRGTTWFPAWQFDVSETRIRPIVAAVLRAWTEAGDEPVDPHAVLSWSRTPQPELEDQSPEEWIVLEKPEDDLLAAARRAARALAT